MLQLQPRSMLVSKMKAGVDTSSESKVLSTTKEDHQKTTADSKCIRLGALRKYQEASVYLIEIPAGRHLRGIPRCLSPRPPSTERVWWIVPGMLVLCSRYPRIGCSENTPYHLYRSREVEGSRGNFKTRPTNVLSIPPERHTPGLQQE